MGAGEPPARLRCCTHTNLDSLLTAASFVAQISEMYMPQRTDNDIKNRWNSIIRKPQHPAGRDWLADENEARAAILGTASRTQVGRRGGAAAAPSAEAGRKRERSVSGAGGSAPSKIQAS